METSQKKEFQNRIVVAGRKELLLIHYEMILAELDMIDLTIQAENDEKFRQSISLTQEMVKKLVESLDFNYELSQDLFRVYEKINKHLIEIKRNKNRSLLADIREHIVGLKEAFAEIKSTEESPLIQNSETVYAGLTYGKDNQLKESVDFQNRGYKA